MVRLRGVRFVAVVAGGVLLLVSGCTGGDEPSKAEVPLSLSGAGDPVPQPSGDPVTLDAEPASFSQGELAVEVEAGAVTSEATLRFGQNLGTVDGEVFGRPVSLEVSEPLAAPVELRWQIGELTEEQRASIVPLRWDEDLQVWAVDESPDTHLRLDGDELVVVTTEFSWRAWAADIGQWAGERTGSRTAGPSCDGELPSWVTSVVDPGEGTSAAAIQVCFEPDGEDTVTVRVVNNRPFTQRLEMAEGGQQWAWTWPGEASYDVSAAVHSAARTAFDSSTSHLLPPLSETAVGIRQPEGGGSHFVAATATVDGTTFLVDMVDYLLGQVTPGGFESPLVNEFVALVYECGGSAVLSGTDFSRVSTAALEVVASCVNEVMTSNSSYGARFDAFRVDMMASASPKRQAELVKANRFLHQLASAAHLLEVGRLAFYFTDQLQNAYVGNLTLSISATGRPGELGNWTASCNDLSTDSNRLFRNLTLRDPFYDTTRELWEFDELEPAAEQAVAPLRDCADGHLAQLADLLPTDWADDRAATTVADRIRGLVSPQTEESARTLTARVSEFHLPSREITFEHVDWLFGDEALAYWASDPAMYLHIDCEAHDGRWETYDGSQELDACLPAHPPFGALVPQVAGQQSLRVSEDATFHLIQQAGHQAEQRQSTAEETATRISERSWEIEELDGLANIYTLEIDGSGEVRSMQEDFLS